MITLTRPAVQRAILYARFSPRPNPDECDSILRQYWDMTDYCRAPARVWLVVYGDHDAAESGADGDREGLWRCIEQLRRGDVLLVRNLNRLARDTLLALVIEQEVAQRGAKLVSIEDGGELLNDPVSQFTREVLHAVAKLQRLIGNERTKARMRAHQANGRRMTAEANVPYGTRAAGSTVVGRDARGRDIVHHGLDTDPFERWIIDHRICPLFRAGCALREICSILMTSGIDCRGRRTWHHNTVRSILEREGLLGPKGNP